MSKRLKTKKVLFSICVAGFAFANTAIMAQEAVESDSCEDVFVPRMELTLTGNINSGTKNNFSDGVTLSLTGAPPSGDIQRFLGGQLVSPRVGTVSFGPATTNEHWGSQCINVAAPDGRRWLFVVVNYQANYHHPNIHGVFDLTDGENRFQGFLDNAEQVFHEAAVSLTHQ